MQGDALITYWRFAHKPYPVSSEAGLYIHYNMLVRVKHRCLCELVTEGVTEGSHYALLLIIHQLSVHTHNSLINYSASNPFLKQQ